MIQEEEVAAETTIIKVKNQILLAKNVPTSCTASTKPPPFIPSVSDFYSYIPPQPLGSSNFAWDTFITESPTGDVQMQDPQLDRPVASVPALYCDAYNIAQIIEL